MKQQSEQEVVIINYSSNERLSYDHLYFHSHEKDLVSLYNGGFGDKYRKIWRIIKRYDDDLTGKLKIWVVEF